MNTNGALAQMLPRVLIVSRRCIRKNKFVDFVGEYHLDLIVSYGAVPVIVPRVSGISTLLHGFEPIHGVLLCEGEDIDPSFYESDISGLSDDQLDEIRRFHSSDSTFDSEKDSIEFSLANHCLDRGIPYLGICRGSQILNVVCGGNLYQDVETEMARVGKQPEVRHIDYDNYDGHRHSVTVVKNTPLHDWFKESLENEKMEINVNSYHHQGNKRLAHRFVPMAYAKDGLIEAFYDPNFYYPDQGKFIMGLQFHPERMRQNSSVGFDYPGCPSAYKEFVRSVIAYQKKVNSSMDCTKLDYEIIEMEKKRKNIIESFSVARNMYVAKLGDDMSQSREPKLHAGADFSELIEATMKSVISYLEKVNNDGDGLMMVKNWMETMSIEQLTQLLHLFKSLKDICSEVLDKKKLMI